MTDLISKLSDQLYSEAIKTNVQTAAGVADSWALHVFRNNFFTIRGNNRGRLPIISFKRLDSNYQNQVDVIGGQVDTRWEIKVIVRTGYGQNTNENQAMQILQAFLKNIHTNAQLRVSDETIAECIPCPQGMEITATLTIQNSWLNSQR